MVWFKVDDSFHSHRKVKSIPRAERGKAIGLWSMAGSLAADQLTDGFVLADDVEDLGCTKKEARALILVRLWHEPGHDCEKCPAVPAGQYLFHDFLEFNRPRAVVLAERAAAAERQRKAREASKAKRDAEESHTDSHAVTSPVTHAATSSDVTSPPDCESQSPRPDPTRPVVSTSVGRESGGSVELGKSPPPKTCPKHPDGTDEPCWPCGQAKAARVDWEAAKTVERKTVEQVRQAEQRRLRQLDVDRCQLCDERGYRLMPDGAQGGVCDHKAKLSAAERRARIDEERKAIAS